MPVIDGVLETAIYVDDLPRAVAFYTGLFGFEVDSDAERLIALRAAPRQMLLLCRRGASVHLSPGSHDGSGPVHLAFAISPDQWQPWLDRLAGRGIAVEEIRGWERGGRSVYFRDPDNHLLELATPGVWRSY